MIYQMEMFKEQKHYTTPEIVGPICVLSTHTTYRAIGYLVHLYRDEDHNLQYWSEKI